MARGASKLKLGPGIIGPGSKHPEWFHRQVHPNRAMASEEDLKRLWPVVEEKIGGAINDAPLWELLTFTYLMGLWHGQELFKSEPINPVWPQK